MKRGKAKPKMGRRPLPDGLVKDVVFTLRVSEAERDMIATAAQRSGKAPTRWARDVLLERARDEQFGIS